ncbi:MAG: patatin-like phospholipase family protein [Gemmatimonadaceae bacterium]|nr:patatin-like phospholipase family protein [Gemmatimonadaceae bacterium]
MTENTINVGAESTTSQYRVLSLDGGGAKGLYTLGVLHEFEKYVGGSLGSYFELIYGTSTGAIIAALLALGKSVAEILDIYLELVPRVMRAGLRPPPLARRYRSNALRREAERIFGDRNFDAFQTALGLVAVDYDGAKPMIFKTKADLAIGRRSSFEAGFGSTIVDALVASTAAFPFFARPRIATSSWGNPEVLDGGYAANNPTMLAIADALRVVTAPERLAVLSIGVGHYKEPKRSIAHQLLFSMWWFYMIPKTLETSTNTMEGLRKALCAHVPCVRIDETYAGSEYATDLLESDRNKLEKLFVLGRTSFGAFESQVKQLFPPLAN